MLKSKISFLLFIIVGVALRCSYWSENYTVLHTSPYRDYGSNSTPGLSDGRRGSAFFFGGNYLVNSTDLDTTVSTIVINGVIRKHLARWTELGFTGNAVIKDRLFPYGAFDIKYQLAKNPIIICPDLAIGAGLGRRAWGFDFRFSTALGYPLIRNRLSIYAAPKVMGLLYPWRAEGTLVKHYSFDLSTLYGVSAGLNYSLPLGLEDLYIVNKLKIQPEITYLIGKEPQFGQMDYRILQIGCQIGLAF
jgi:hypothetical protein